MSFPRILLASFLFSLAAVGVRAAEPVKPKDGPLGMKFVPLPKGTFYMGWDGVKKGVKTEIKEDFEIAVHTVTQGQWQAVMGNNPSSFSRGGSRKDKVKDITDEDLKLFPVESVTLADAQKFVKKLNEKEAGRGWLYRLPTEAEWEYACRGGATSEEECSFHFYFDNPTNELTLKLANFNGYYKGPFLGRPTRVGSYPPNKLGLYDMHGNVCQWYSAPEGAKYTYRGGCWNDYPDRCQASYHDKYAPVDRYLSIGFRLARVPAAGK